VSAGQVTQGRRIPDFPSGIGARFAPGDYGKIKATWYACTPNGLLGNLANHEVTEYEDGTISVSPSILVDGGQPDQWHGFLERGIWREV